MAHHINFDRHLRVSSSSLPEAGLGVFAKVSLPAGAWGEYQGIFQSKVTELQLGGTRSWQLFSYDQETGRSLGPECNQIIGYLDGSTGMHWTRYVNGADTSHKANMEQIQLFNRVYYRTLREISSDEELLVDYGFDPTV